MAKNRKATRTSITRFLHESPKCRHRKTERISNGINRSWWQMSSGFDYIDIDHWNQNLYEDVGEDAQILCYSFKENRNGPRKTETINGIFENIADALREAYDVEVMYYTEDALRDCGFEYWPERLDLSPRIRSLIVREKS